MILLFSFEEGGLIYIFGQGEEDDAVNFPEGRRRGKIRELGKGVLSLGLGGEWGKRGFVGGFEGMRMREEMDLWGGGGERECKNGRAGLRG